MTAQTFFCAVGCIIFFCLAIGAIKDDTAGAMFICFFVSGVFGYYSYQGTTPEHKAEVAREEAAEREHRRQEETPHVIREADGCKVYAFKVGERYHYFTRCPSSQVSTETTWQECHKNGKQEVCEEKSDTIATKGS